MTLLLSAYDCEGPGDARDLSRLLAALPRDRLRRLAVLGKTEGTATLNDFSREVAIGAARAAITEQLGAAARPHHAAHPPPTPPAGSRRG